MATETQTTSSDTTTQAAATTTAPQPDPAAHAAANQAAAQAASAAANNTTAVDTAEQIAAKAAAAKPIEYTLALPKDAVIEAGAIERTTAFAKAAGLAPDVAQKALELANGEVAADRTRQAEATKAAFDTLVRETWPNEIKADKDFGGDKLTATIAEAKLFMDRFATPEERQALETTGWGNHPILVRWAARVGRAMKDDKFHFGGAGGGERDVTMEGRASRLYPEKKA